MNFRNAGWWAVCAAFTLLFLSAPAQAGMYYKATTTTTSEGRQVQDLTAEAWIDGELGRVEIREADGNPILREGAYIVTRDGGRTMYLVDPEKETYSEWDVDALLRFAGNMMEGMSGLMKMEFSDPEVELLLEESGGEILGQETTHYRFRSQYSIDVRVLGMRQASDNESVHDLWVVPGLDNQMMGLWLRNEPPSTGSDDLDELLASEISKVKGFPMKQEIVTTTISSKGRGRKKKAEETESRTVTEVVELDMNVSLDPARAKVPEGFEEVPLFGASNDDDNPFSQIFNRDG